MRIVIDLQGAQSESRFRGIGRYSLALALGIARNAGQHEVWLVLNGALGDAIAPLREQFKDFLPRHRIRVFDAPGPVRELAAENSARARNAEMLREYFIDQLRPDMVLVTSLFEGFVDDAVTSIGSFTDPARTAVVLYDLIPLLKPDSYLGSDVQRAHYFGKIASLRRASLLLSISDYSRKEALAALCLPDQQVVSISTAVDPTFAPASMALEQREALGQRFAITKAFLMYAPGGFDARKNIDGLITAFGLLPPAVRANYQLVLASKISTEQRQMLLNHAHECGLGDDEIVITGYISDADLIALYRSTTLFIFPSRHEGFGLPALEAMACGARVIGARNTSIPEVIGCEEAMFDADDPHAIASKIGEVLQDEQLQSRLSIHGREQASRFSWDLTARRAIAALEQRCSELKPVTVATPRSRRRLAFVSPLPPERTGIADYAVQLLPALRLYFDIELVLQQDKVDVGAELQEVPHRTVAWFNDHAAEFDQILYQFGNSPFHSHMFALLRQHPGVVVLHDFYLGDVLAYEQMTGAIPSAWTGALYHAHGYGAALGSIDADRHAHTKEQFPCNLAVLEDATSVVVHSEHSLELAQKWYGASATSNWNVVPLPRSAPERQARDAARRALGLNIGDFVVCTFGFIAPTKMSLELVQAWAASSLHSDTSCVLMLVGQNHGGDYGLAISAAITTAAGRIRIAGWTDDATYHQYLQAADVGVQLRSVSRGETSAAVLDCLNYGLATIVNAKGSMASLPDDTVFKLPEQFELAALSDALVTLRNDSEIRADLGQRAQHLLRTTHSPDYCAQRYADLLDREWQARPVGRQALISRLAAQSELDERAVQELAWCIARLPDPLAPRQLLIDVTAIARHDLKTGIERVVRTQMQQLLNMRIDDLRVEPVYLSNEGGRWHYRYARSYVSQMLGLGAHLANADSMIDIACNDIFYSADYSPGAVLAAAADGLYAQWRARGIAVHFVVYDLLPVLRPEFFPPDADATHAPWLACIAREADQLICISASVESELRQWLDQTTAPSARRAALCSLHLGADITGVSTAPAPSTSADAADLLTHLRDKPTFLMVGTIEPRKGHLQTLAAFDLLWEQGIEINLVVVGNEGWTPLDAAQRRTIPAIVARLTEHPALGERLHWLRGIDDELLDQLYGISACLLVPSEGEGFGLPLIEAARNALPVIARDLAVFHEVAGDAAHYFSGTEAAALANAITAWLRLDAQGQAPQSQTMSWMTWREHCERLLKLLLLV